MRKYTVSKDTQLSHEELDRIISSFISYDLPILNKRYNYYIGNQNILKKEASDTGKPCNKVVCNFVNNVINAYEGYAMGIPVTYNSTDKGFESLQSVLNYNSVIDEDADFFRQGLIFGKAVEICFVDEYGKQRFKVIDPRGIIPVYDNTLNEELLYVIRFWEEHLYENNTPTYKVQVYDAQTVTTYETNSGYSSYTFLSQEKHFFTQVPFSIFSLNDEESAIGDNIFSLQDAYNSLLSDSIDDWDSFCDAYLVLKGMDATSDDLDDMKKKRALLMDSDASAEYLIKNTSTTEIEHLLSTVEQKIRELSSCPNFNSETFGTSSGIAIKYRMMQMENNVSSMLSNFKKALQRRIELIGEISAVVNGEALWRDIQITFTRNNPTDLTDVVQVVNQLRGVVSEETLLSLLPFVADVPQELEKLNAERNVTSELYRFDNE